jgi:hypothetical protein
MQESQILRLNVNDLVYKILLSDMVYRGFNSPTNNSSVLSFACNDWISVNIPKVTLFYNRHENKRLFHECLNYNPAYISNYKT